MQILAAPLFYNIKLRYREFASELLQSSYILSKSTKTPVWN